MLAGLPIGQWTLLLGNCGQQEEKALVRGISHYPGMSAHLSGPSPCILFEQVLITRAGNPSSQSCFFPPGIGHSCDQPYADSSEVTSMEFLEGSAALP